MVYLSMGHSSVVGRGGYGSAHYKGVGLNVIKVMRAEGVSNFRK